MFVRKLVDVDPDLAEMLKKKVFKVLGCCQTVHRELGPFLNEYVYQDAVEVMLKEKKVEYVREYEFSVTFRKQTLGHTHRVDFLCEKSFVLECKAIEALGTDQRQQLWNYMRLLHLRVGILYNFAPYRDQCEKYYLDDDTKEMFMF